MIPVVHHRSYTPMVAHPLKGPAEAITRAGQRPSPDETPRSHSPQGKKDTRFWLLTAKTVEENLKRYLENVKRHGLEHPLVQLQAQELQAMQAAEQQRVQEKLGLTFDEASPPDQPHGKTPPNGLP